MQLRRPLRKLLDALGRRKVASEVHAPDHKPLLLTPYDLGPVNKAIPLLNQEGRLSQNGAVVYDGPLSLSFDWLPRPTVRFGIASTDAFLSPQPGEAILALTGAAAPARVFVGRVSLGAASEIEGSLTEPLSFGGGEPVDGISFLLPNTATMHGDWIVKEGAGGWIGRVILERPPWRVTLEARRDNRAIVGELKGVSGYAATHVGWVARQDGSEFSVSHGKTVLEWVNLFLSFARGFWTPALLPVGYRGDSVVWQEWLGSTASPWHANFSWYSPIHPDALIAVFPGFVDRLDDPNWEDSLKLALWWYVEANGTTTAETSLMLSQAVLELFSWVILVREKKLKSAAAHRSDTAENNIRELLTWANIPLALPATLKDLGGFVSGQGWSDGPQALIRFRNKLTHPGGKATAIFLVPASARVELRQLALWYVELVLLRFLNYRGDYSNRLEPGGVGDVELVPWA
jgi:hypothetical protein